MIHDYFRAVSAGGGARRNTIIPRTSLCLVIYNVWGSADMLQEIGLKEEGAYRKMLIRAECISGIRGVTLHKYMIANKQAASVELGVHDAHLRIP